MSFQARAIIVAVLSEQAAESQILSKFGPNHGAALGEIDRNNVLWAQPAGWS